MIQYRIQETAVQVIHDDREVTVKNGVLIEGDQLCTIYDLDGESFLFVCTSVHDLTHMLASQGLSVQIGNGEAETADECNEKMLYVCNECHELHEDETHTCELCQCKSLRIVSREELIN